MAERAKNGCDMLKLSAAHADCPDVAPGTHTIIKKLHGGHQAAGLGCGDSGVHFLAVLCMQPRWRRVGFGVACDVHKGVENSGFALFARTMRRMKLRVF